MLFVVVFISLLGTSLTSSISKRGGGHHAPLINCPTCEHHDCDRSNVMQCEVCQIHVPHPDQPPANTKCAHAGHCHSDQHNHCCDTEACVESFFGKSGETTIQAVTHATGCPHCHGGNCDFINRDQCYMCKLDLHDGQLPHVHCLNDNEECHPKHNTLCCQDETCIAQAFGSDYVQSHHPSSHNGVQTTTTPSPTVAGTTPAAASTSATSSPLPTTSSTSQAVPIIHHTTEEVTPQRDPRVQCPILICAHHHCDTNNFDLCDYACQITLHHDQPTETKCVDFGHCHEPADGHSKCCTNNSCIASIFGQQQLQTQTVSCPLCNNHICESNNLNFNCIGCMYDYEHGNSRCLLTENNHDCVHIHNKQTCCKTETCLAQVFGPLPTSSGTTVCPKCDEHSCTFESCHYCLYQLKDGHLPHFKGCVVKENPECNHQPNKCCHDSNCTYALFGSHYHTTVSPSHSSTIEVVQSTTKAHSTTPLKTTLAALTSQQTHSTISPEVTVKPSLITSDQLTSHMLSVATSTNHAVTTGSTTTPATTRVETTTQIPSSTEHTSFNCTDEIPNCELYKSMGACHALPQQKENYDVAFKCQKTCNRCNDTYQPLTTPPTTIGTTRAPMHCQVCGDYDNDNPCSLASIYMGPFVPCTDGNYCMNDVIQQGGNTKTFKRCVNETICKTLWLAQTSDQDQCIQYNSVVSSGDFSCHFCCSSDKCNQGLIPDKSTFYTVT